MERSTDLFQYQDPTERYRIAAETVSSIFSKSEREKDVFFGQLLEMLLDDRKDEALEILNVLSQTTFEIKDFRHLVELLGGLKMVGEERVYSYLTEKVVGLLRDDPEGFERVIRNFDVRKTRNAALLLTVFEDVIDNSVHGLNETPRTFFEKIFGILLEKFSSGSVGALSRRKAKALSDRSVLKIGSSWSTAGMKKLLREYDELYGLYARKDLKDMNADEIRQTFLEMTNGTSPFYEFVSADEFYIKKKKIENKYGTRKLRMREVVGGSRGANGELVEETRLTSRFLFVPITREFYGVYNESGLCFAVFPKGKKNYEHREAVSLGGVQGATSRSLEGLEAAQLYKMFLDHDVLDGVEEDYKFPVRELTAREQMWFINSLKNYTDEDEKRVIGFTQKFGLAGARAFLSCEFGDSFRQTVLDIGEKMPEALARQVFEQYGKLALLAQEKSEELIREFTAEGKKVKVSVAAVEQELLRRAKDLLVLAAESEKEPEKLREQLARCQEDVAVFASIFKAAFRNNSRFDFAELKGVSFETLKGSELSETDREQMLIIARENWKKTPGLLPTVIGSLEKAVSSSKNIFRVLRKDGKVIAYIRSERLSTDEVYAGSANVAKEYQKSAIGDALFASSLDEDAKENIVYGNAHIDSHIGMTYVERYGFVIDGIEEVETESGIDYGFKIVRDDSVNPNYRSRQTKNPAEAAVFQMPEDRIRLVELVKKETAVGRVGTRFYSEPENPKKVFIVFEDRVQARKKAA